MVLRIIWYGILLIGAITATALDAGDELFVDDVWAGHSVGFALLTDAPWQYAAYYNRDRQLTVAARRLMDTVWSRVTLPETVGWDSHNYVTLAVDDAHSLHLSGNMHVSPLVYFKTSAPGAIQHFTRLAQLVGREEGRMTYPRFFTGPSGEFIFTYRDGSSGSGNQIYNTYQSADQSWHRLLDTPLTDGGGAMNAYFDGPRLGPDGVYHVVWVWRDTPDCATNHHLSYMRSRDLRHWENVRGEALSLPVTIDSPGTVVDPVPPGGGLINGNARLGFDGAHRPVISYHKYDAAGISQIYNARWMGAGWVRTPVTAWTTRWDFQGGGSIVFDVRVGPVEVEDAGELVQTWSHRDLGRERWRLDPDTLEAREKLPLKTGNRPRNFNRPALDFPEIAVRSASDLGQSPDDDIQFVLRWESLGPNRDRPRTPPFPPSAPLTLHALSTH